MTNFELITLIFSSVSILLSIVALLFSKKDKPCFMPSSHIFTPYSNVSHLMLILKNSSDKVIHDVTVLINMFDNNLDELTSKLIENKLYYPISNNSEFNFKIESLDSPFFMRVRFRGKYYSWVPFFKFSFNQIIWYSLYPIYDPKSKQITGFNVYNAYQNEIEQLKIKYKKQFQLYDNRIDNKKWFY